MNTAELNSTSSPLDEIIAAYLQALERGEHPNRLTLLSSHPTLAKDLAAFFADFDRVQAAAPGNHYGSHANLDATKPPRGEAHPGETIAGRYKLLENIGEGGMGSVWVAEQTQPVKRRVAIKLIKAGMDSKQVLARFEAERQALAMMDHPNIARVFDGGMTDLGRPYFVMEYVKGTPFTEYCDQARLSLNERLQLFIPVCGAVQHAHQKGIIHRDLKPSNILICLYDGKPVPKVIDFGLAKAMHQPLTENTIYTGHGVMVGTPLYMSPEQAEQNNLDVDTRTDIFSLGVVLYELLTGTTPLEREQLRKAAGDEVLRLIREVEPIRPSIRTSASASLPSIAAQRNLKPKELRRTLAGDLDWIVMKSLEKERSRRYETANGLARDIERYLVDEAVEACPPSTGYRLKKYFRKHKWQVTTATIVLGALIIGMCGAIYGFIQATDGQRRTQNALMEITKQKVAREKALNEKSAALDAVSKAKDFAERQMIDGLLRPIGHGDEPNTSELRSFLDWASLPDVRLRVRVLEVAFEDPEIALRLARRAERVSQACVGLSPARRALAMKLMLTKQRDLNSDPRLRIAAAWLALELGSTDLPALPESLLWLGKPTNSSADMSQRVDLLGLVALITSRREQMSDEQISLGWDALLDVLQRSTEENVLRAAGDGLSALCPSLGEDEVLRGGDALIAILEKSSNGEVISATETALAAVAQKLNQKQNAHACNVLLRVLEESTDHVALNRVDYALAELVPSLSPEQTSRCGDVLLTVLEKSKSYYALKPAGEILSIIASKLSEDQVNRGCNASLSRLETSTDSTTLRRAAIALAALSSLLGSDQVTRGADALIGVLQKSEDGAVLQSAANAFAGLAPKLSAEQVTHGWDALIGVLKKPTEFNSSRAASDALTTLAPKLKPEQVNDACDSLLSVLESSTSGDALVSAGIALAAIAPRLVQEQHTSRWSLVLDIFENSKDEKKLQVSTIALAAFAPKLTSEQISRSCMVFLHMLENSTDYDTLEAVRNALKVLAPKLGPAQRNRMTDSILTVLHRRRADELLDLLFCITPHLETSVQERISHKAMATLLDNLATSDTYFATYFGRNLDSFHPVTMAIMDKRALARFLQHPASIGEPRNWMLQRFEELVFHGGNRVFLSTLTQEEEAKAGSEITPAPPRRFRTLHDASTWIQKNWPDFDLESTPEVVLQASE